MRSFRFSQHIDRPVEEIFAFMMDFRTAPRWRSLVRHMEVVGGGPVQLGSKILLTMDVMGKAVQLEAEVWRYEPPYRFGMRNTNQGITGNFEYVLEPGGAGTTVTFTCDIRPHGLMWLTLPFILPGNRDRYRGQLAALKRALDQRQGVTASEISTSI
jgi:hypothetical protein